MHPQAERGVRRSDGGLLDLYHEEYDRERPVVCFDESSKLDFVHLRGVGEDVGELSVNCGWGVFSCRVSTLDFVQKLDKL